LTQNANELMEKKIEETTRLEAEITQFKETVTKLESEKTNLESNKNAQIKDLVSKIILELMRYL
jgi:hypothetical protein